MRKSIQHVAAAVFLSLALAAPSWGYEKEIDALSVTMAEKIASKGKTRVAVVDFADLEGNVRYFDKFIAEQFSVALSGSGKGFRVIERNHLNSLIKEHKLSATGMIDSATAMKLGKIAGADALVTGTLTPIGDNVQLIVKVLDANTADIIDSAKINIARTQAVNELLDKEIAPDIADGSAAQKSEAKTAQGKETKKDKGGSSGPFSDDFNAGPKPDWKPINGNWTMSNGQYTVTDIESQARYITFIDGKKWNDIVFDIDVIPGETGQGGFYYRAIANICPRMINSEEKVCFGLSGSENKFVEAYWYISKEGTKNEHVSIEKIETPKNQPVNVKIEVKGGVFTAYINNLKINQVYDSTFSAGTIGLIQWYDIWEGPVEKKRVSFDNIEIKPLAD